MNVLNILDLCKLFGGNFDPSKKYVIAIQGVSTSGKSTFASMLSTRINASGSNCKAVVISTDNFYKSNQLTGDDIEIARKTYDFDNPGSIDWNALRESVKEYIDGRKNCKKYVYDYIDTTRDIKKVKNNGTNIIIVEGIFAHNLFSEECFKEDEFDPKDTKKPIENSYVENSYIKKLQNTKVLKIFFDISDKTLIENRLKCSMEKFNESEEDAKKKVEEMVIPATKKWIRPAKEKSDVKIENGNWNISESVELMVNILTYFKLSADKKSIEDEFEKLKKNK